MLNRMLKRAYMISAALHAVKRCNDPMFFLKLLQRPDHLKPKPGHKSPDGKGKKFKSEVKKQARRDSLFLCVFCNKNKGRSEVDHAIPRSKGGSRHISNAQNTCTPCNQEKGNLTTEEYLTQKWGNDGRLLIRGAGKRN